LYAFLRAGSNARLRGGHDSRRAFCRGRRARQGLRRAVPSRKIGRRGTADPPEFPGTLRLMLSKRIIACLDVRDGQVVKGVQFQQLRHAGDPAELARRYNVEGIDEVVVLDITATIEARKTLAATVRAVAGEIFLPLAVGGGIRSEEDAA